MLDLKTFAFPMPTGIFCTIKTDPALLKEATARGFYNGRTKYNDLASELFFRGGTLTYRKDVEPEFIKRAVPYMKAFMMSFEPKHEEKEAIVALILSELV